MQTTEPTQSTSTSEMFPLDAAAIEIIADIDRQMTPLNLMLQGALALFIRQHKLDGHWKVAANRKELIKVNQ